MEKVVRKLGKKNTDTVLTIDTDLINKEEVFKMCALAQCTGRGLLLLGDPGVKIK